MRYGTICKALHVLPRSGGLLEQPSGEMIRLEQILNAFARYEDYQNKKSSTRSKNRKRHEPTVITAEGF